MTYASALKRGAILLSAALPTCLAIVSCDPVLDEVRAKKIRIRGEATTVSANAGTIKFSATIEPDASNSELAWHAVPGTGLATFSADGRMTAQADGTVTVFAEGSSATSNTIDVSISNQAPGWKRVGEKIEADYPAAIKIAVSSEGTPYVGFHDTERYTSNDSYYMLKYDGAEWRKVGSSIPLESAADSYSSSWQSTMAVSVDGTPYTAIADVSAAQITVRRFNGRKWTKIGEAISTSSVRGFNSLRISLSAQGTAYLSFSDSYSDYSTQYLYLYRFNGNSWDRITPLAYKSTTYDFKIDSAGIPYVAYRHPTYGMSVKRYASSGAWESVGSEYLPLSSSYYSEFSLAIPAEGRPIIACVNNKKILAFNYDGSSWNALGSEIDLSIYSSYAYVYRLTIAPDQFGKPVIAVIMDYTDKLAYVFRYDGAAWTSGVNASYVDTSSGEYFFTQDPKGNPVIVVNEGYSSANSGYTLSAASFR